MLEHLLDGGCGYRLLLVVLGNLVTVVIADCRIEGCVECGDGIGQRRVGQVCKGGIGAPLWHRSHDQSSRSVRQRWSVWGIIAKNIPRPHGRRERHEDQMPSTSNLTPPVVTRDGRLITIRLIQSEDKDALLAFGTALPEEDWLYLESDMRSADTVARLANAQGAEHWRQVVAVDGERIAAYASIRMYAGRYSHVAAVQMVVGEDWRRQGLGRAMGAVIVAEAQRLEASKIIAEMLEAQRNGQAIFAHLGFRTEGTLIAHARDRFGKRHNLVVMALVIE